jgi:hypothetical protein
MPLYQMGRDSFLKTVIPLSGLTFLGVYNLPPLNQAEAAPHAAKVEAKHQVEQSVYYSGCNAVRAAGKAPLFIGSPGYREGMDGDSDGIACEPYYGN